MTPATELLADHQSLHSDLQMDRFITIKNGGTPYGCYKQALRELHKRYNAIREMELQIAEAEIDLEEAGDRVKRADSETNGYRRATIDHKRKLLALENLEQQFAETRREFSRFHQQASALKEIVGELTEERRSQLDAEFWEHRVKSMMAVEIAVYGKPGTSTLELLQCLPPAMRQSLLKRLDTPDGGKGLAIEFFSESPVGL